MLGSVTAGLMNLPRSRRLRGVQEMAGPVESRAFVTVTREPVVVMKSDTAVVVTADASTSV